MNWLQLLPFVYGFRTRVRTLAYKISFLVVTVLPSFYFILVTRQVNTEKLLGYLIALISMYSLYEIGYIYNDIYTTSFEKKPTMRSSIEEMTFLKRAYPILIMSRVVVITFSVIYFKNYDRFISWLLLLLLLYIAYIFHNFTRSTITAFTMFTIVALKYIIPSFLFVEELEWYLYLGFILAVVPFARFVEYGSKPYCGLFNVKNFHKFRIIYYLVLTILSLLLLLFDIPTLPYIPLILIFLFYRGVIYIVEKKSGGAIHKKEVGYNG
ncbi:hypothetical protein [Streptococcus sp. S784/96/1]|uniref:hypothetical protein n=1 Tax=Streptococcus sp. S784/96/1 TaxID=2653499 RepID=UPI001386A965|nr:hypothetical protein [Streptococcus sp. S784/96/1]